MLTNVCIYYVMNRKSALYVGLVVLLLKIILFSVRFKCLLIKHINDYDMILQLKFNLKRSTAKSKISQTSIKCRQKQLTNFRLKSL